MTVDQHCDLKNLLVYAEKVQRMFKGFPEVLLLDASGPTYRRNKHTMPVSIFMFEDDAGCSHVVAYAFVA